MRKDSHCCSELYVSVCCFSSCSSRILHSRPASRAMFSNAASEQRLLAGSKCFLLHCERARAVHLCLVVLSDARSQTQSNLLQLLRICRILDAVGTMADNPNVALDVTCNKRSAVQPQQQQNAGTNLCYCRCGQWRA